MSQLFPTPWSEAQLSDTLSEVMRRVYLWMCLGLMVTAAVGVLVVSTPLILIIARAPILLIGLFVAELALVIGVSAMINRLSPATALALFLVYAALNGVTLSLIFVVYTLGSIALAFFATACLFGAMSVVGYTTRIDLTRLGGFLLMALLGMILASVVNLFLANSTLDWIITYAGILIFVGLTAYDTQRIKRMVAATQGDETALGRIGVLGALALYLDFINLFLRLLRVMGRRR